MRPTHRHADGGVYELVEPCPHKDDATGEWVAGFAYRGEDGKLRSTSAKRWQERFEELNCEEVGEQVFDLRDEEEKQIASFVFRTYEADDLRYMLVTPGAFDDRMRPQEQHWLSRVVQAAADMVTQGLHIREHNFPDLIGDVAAFHAKFGQEYLGKPRLLPDDLFDFRVKFHDEETHEYRDEQPKLLEAIERRDRRDIINSLELQLDALCDAAWVILGTADLQFGRKAFYEAWRRVVKANMAKVRKDLTEEGDGSKDSGRAPKYDIVKPAGWMAPDHRDLVSDNAIFDEVFALPAAEPEFMGTAQDVDRYSDTRSI